MISEKRHLHAVSMLEDSIMRFVRTRDKAVRAHGLEPLQFQFMSLVEPFQTKRRQPNIAEVANQLSMQHHSAVEMVDRLVERGWLRRKRANHDRRHVLLKVTPQGKKVLKQAIRQEYADVHAFAPELVRDLKSVLNGHRRRTAT